MSLKQQLQQVLPAQIADDILEEVIDETQSIRDGATDAGIIHTNILDDALNKLDNSMEEPMDIDLRRSILELLRGQYHQN